LSIIELLVDAPEGLALGDITARTGLPHSAAHRTLGTLVERGYVRQHPATQAYALGLKLAALGFRLLDERHLPDAAQGVLDALAADTGEYCRLAVVDGGSLAWIARAQGSSEGLRYDPPMGRDVVLFATATGKAWLASHSDDEALRLVFAQGFPVPDVAPAPRFGAGVVRTLDALRADLAATRERGYAVAIEEGEAGAAAVAATFHADATRTRVAGTVSVAGPVTRMDHDARTRIAARLLEATAELSAIWPLRRRQSTGVTGAGRAVPRVATAAGAL
jgi:DNA-binding IclR family transcriptional regulator